MKSKHRLIDKVHAMGEEYFVLTGDIKPYGKGSRRYVLGRHIEQPKDSHLLSSGCIQITPGKQEYFNEPMDGIDFKPWLDQFIIDNKIKT